MTPLSYHLSNLLLIALKAMRLLVLTLELNPNKAHHQDGLSIGMLQMIPDSISKFLSIIFRNCLKTGCYRVVRKKANVVPVHKQKNKQIFSNYRSLSFLPNYGKLFEKNYYLSNYLSYFLSNYLFI